MKYRMSMLSLGVIAFVLFFSASCIPEFKNPLPVPKEMKSDRKILGTWESVPEENKSQVSFFSKKEGGMYIVFINDTDGDEPPDVSVMQGYTTNLNKNKFLCLWFIKKAHQNAEDEKEEPMCRIAHYHISSEGILSINMFSQYSIKRMIEKGKLKGEIEVRSYSDKVTVTSSSEELAAAIIKEGVESFISDDEGDYVGMKFQRLKR